MSHHHNGQSTPSSSATNGNIMMNNQSNGTNGSSIPSTNKSIPLRPKQFQDVLDVMRDPNSVLFFEYSTESQVAKRTLNWAIYFYQHKEFVKARDALIKCGELISTINSQLTQLLRSNTTPNHHDEGDSSKKNSMLVQQQQLQAGKDFLFKIILLVEHIDFLLKQPQRQSSQSKAPTPSQQQQPSTTNSSSSSTQKTLSRISSGIFSKITSIATGSSSSSSTLSSSSGSSSNPSNSSSESSLLRFINNVGSALKKPKEDAPIPNLAESYVQEQYVFIEFMESKNNPKTISEHPKTIPTSNAGIVLTTPSSSSTSRESVSTLQQRLQTVMKGTKPSQPQQQLPTIQQPQPPPSNVLPRLSLDVSPNENRSPQSASRMKSFIHYMDSRKDLTPDNISPQDVKNMIKILNENLKTLGSSSNYKAVEALGQIHERILPFKKQILKELSNQSTKEKSKKLYMLKKFLKIAFAAQMVNHFISKEQSVNTLQENLQQFFEVDNFTLQLLIIYGIAESFDHTYFCLSYLLNCIENFSQTINSVNQYQVEKRQIYRQVDELVFGHLRNRIMELKWCFGIDTFAYVTNDFDGDALLALDTLLSCLVGWQKVKSLMGDYSVNNPSSTSNIIADSLAHFVRKVYILNREIISNNLKQSGRLKGFFLEATFNMNLATFVVDESKQLIARFAPYLDKHLVESNTSFADIICSEFSKHLTVEVSAFCQEALKYQNACIEQGRKNKYLRVYFNELNLGVINKLCSHLATKYRVLQELSAFVGTFDFTMFYEIVSLCITVATPNRLKDFYAKVMSMDTLDKPIDKTVLYTFSCIDMANASLKPIHTIYNLDGIIRNQNDKYLSFLTLHFEAIRPTISEYLQTMLSRCKFELSKQGNVHDRIRLACIAFNNVNGLFLYAKDILQHFNNAIYTQLLEDYERNIDPEDEDNEVNYNLLHDKLIEVYDFPTVKSIMNEIQMITTDMAFCIADWIYTMNEQRFEAIFTSLPGKEMESLVVLLSSLDRFFIHLSDVLYLELLHEVLKHLFVIYVQKLLRNKLLGCKQQSHLNASELLSPISSVPPSMDILSSSPGTSMFQYNSPNVGIQLCLNGFRDLFYANGEGLPLDFLEQQSKELDILLLIYTDDTESLINLYESLIGENDDKTLIDLYERFSNHLPSSNGGVHDESDNISIASGHSGLSSNSSTDSVVMLSLQQTINNKNKNDFLSPELILLLLNKRKKDRRARQYAKQRLKKDLQQQ
ncbi:hypothetical protein C9374_004682 [Naegleria lovaniensis]|uniref:MHD2 domain-containing protein n=1 Tax=Naegleria lovaniensis TaxID=51637 RepID=A0AA88KL76_NAELO|nr:uncharacterized protein C9374_004682 [Naegleria lovaniensis]KAG2383345.1 hypothetical protein C9374_004682 [Naegleria lovaniensis]